MKEKYLEVLQEQLEQLQDLHSVDFVSIVEAIINRVDFEDVNDDNLYDAVNQALNDELIYYDDEWTIAKEYTMSPWDLNMDDAIMNLFDLCFEIATNIFEAYREDEI